MYSLSFKSAREPWLLSLPLSHALSVYSLLSPGQHPDSEDSREMDDMAEGFQEDRL